MIVEISEHGSVCQKEESIITRIETCIRRIPVQSRRHGQKEESIITRIETRLSLLVQMQDAASQKVESIITRIETLAVYSLQSSYCRQKGEFIITRIETHKAANQ